MIKQYCYIFLDQTFIFIEADQSDELNEAEFEKIALSWKLNKIGAQKLFNHDLKQAKAKITRCVIAGLISCAMTLVLNFMLLDYGAMDLWAYVDIFIALALTFGIYRKSRVCAISLFCFFLLSKVVIFMVIPEEAVRSLMMSIIFLVAYWQGIQGTFAYHKLMKKKKTAPVNG